MRRKENRMKRKALQMNLQKFAGKTNVFPVLDNKFKVGKTKESATTIAGKQFSNGHDAEGYFEWEFPDGTTVSWDAAVFDVKNCGGGDSTNVAALEFDAISNGKPTVTPAV